MDVQEDNCGNCRAEDFEVTMPARDYIERFRDAERFMECCRQCKAFGHTWACPPFSHDCEAELRRYSTVFLKATKIYFRSRDAARYERQVLPERWRLESEMRRMERLTGGRAFVNVGRCLHCPEGNCTRLSGEPCRHPELVRPSLEAYGFDLTRTATELFGIDMKWGAGGQLPEYLTLICAVFY